MAAGWRLAWPPGRLHPSPDHPHGQGLGAAHGSRRDDHNTTIQDASIGNPKKGIGSLPFRMMNPSFLINLCKVKIQSTVVPPVNLDE